MIVIIPTGGSNLSSVGHCLMRTGMDFHVSESPEDIRAASHIILPGVGFAKTAMKSLSDKGLVEIIKNASQPVLGICLGMQILFESSAEGDVECLGILPGRVEPFQPNLGLTIPHMGWNKLELQDRFYSEHHLMHPDDKDKFCYFVHSFVAPMGDWVEAYSDYGVKVPAIVNKGNFFGVQFHPERSGVFGQRLVERFLTK